MFMQSLVPRPATVFHFLSGNDGTSHFGNDVRSHLGNDLTSHLKNDVASHSGNDVTPIGWQPGNFLQNKKIKILSPAFL